MAKKGDKADGKQEESKASKKGGRKQKEESDSGDD